MALVSKMNRQKATVDDVFTPRMSDVNPDMYVKRPPLERTLREALSENIHILLFGDSGNGKSWLYKKVLDEESIPYVVANCANAARINSITDAIVEAVVAPGTAFKRSYTESKTAGLSAVFADTEIAHEGVYDMQQVDPLLYAFEQFSKNAGKKKKKIVVLDNLEQAFRRPELMSELASIIILLDDPNYAQHRLAFLIVGVPDNVLDYFASVDDLSSVANRLYEVDKVRGLTKQQVSNLVRRGFRLLGIKIQDAEITDIIDHVFVVTLGIPQRVHEYCKQLARQMLDRGGRHHPDNLVAADERWLKQGFRKSLTVINANLNSRNTKVARRNQVIFVIGHSDRLHFEPSHVDDLVKREFTATIPKSGTIPIGEILKQLSTGKNPLLSRMKSGNEYSFRDARDIMCIRLLLVKDRDSRVRKRALAR